MSTIKVVIAEDQHLFAEGLKHVLEGESKGTIQVVSIAENGAVAVEQCRDHNPDMVLMDIRMPVMDGVEAVSIIKEKFPRIRCLVLTTFEDDDMAYNALHSGANGFVLKSIEPEELVNAIIAVHGGGFYISSSVGLKLINNMKTEKKEKTEPDDGGGESIRNVVARICTKLPELSLREAEVLAYMLLAERNVTIAEKLFISEKTVKNHISNIYYKVGIHSRLGLISYAAKIGIIQTQDGFFS